MIGKNQKNILLASLSEDKISVTVKKLNEQTVNAKGVKKLDNR